MGVQFFLALIFENFECKFGRNEVWGDMGGGLMMNNLMSFDIHELMQLQLRVKQGMVDICGHLFLLLQLILWIFFESHGTMLVIMWGHNGKIIVELFVVFLFSLFILFLQWCGLNTRIYCEKYNYLSSCWEGENDPCSKW